MDEGGIVFFRTGALDAVVDFYTKRVGATVWREQPDCTILEYDGFHFGFCDRADPETDGILTFVVPDRGGVDAAHERLAAAARETPHLNETYGIYQFFADDPEGRVVEFQCFE
ncbi:VOC family protein [Salinirubellus salinus]|uniref:VOC family protein n=1 Tax=Salinirubellus salinus TaxID=1364945 RepID=A0A9E7UC38_9EURY|nr:VOC family protein [Salinirubellus salinus]UWM55893.1 VOC family protein [Salinirubellus salinus]